MLDIQLDPLGGIAGDMFVAAMIDLRPDLAPGLLQTLAQTPLLEGVRVAIVEADDGVLAGRRFLVQRDHDPHRGHDAAHHAHGHSHPAHDHHAAHGHHEAHGHVAWQDIRDALFSAPFDAVTRDHAIGIFTLLAEAEAHVHGTEPDMVAFHEVGAWDSIADIVAAAWLIGQIGAARWTVGALPLGGGRVRTAHGLLPVPAPATARLLEGFETIDDGVAGERVTPTGAAIVRYLCGAQLSGVQTPDRRARRLSGSAHGFGTRSLPGLCNCLRVLAFQTGARAASTTDRIVVLECEIDDQTGEDLALAVDRVRALDGVIDIVQAPVFGKKGRLMTHVRVLATERDEDAVATAIFAETTTLGLRRSLVDRHVLNREMATTEIGDRAFRVKLADRPDGRTAKVETDDLADVEGHRGRKHLRALAERPFEDKKDSR